MNNVNIHPNLFLIHAWHGVIGVLGTLIVAAHLVSFWNGDFPEMWFLYFPAGIYMMVHGFGSSFGYFRIRYPSVKVGENRVETEGTNWPRAIEFEKVKRIELKRSKIQAEFTSTGNKDYIRIPFMLRRKETLKSLQNALENRCSQSGVEFSAAVN